MEIRTTNGARTFDARADADLPGATASVPAGDDFLNGLVFSRGRFLVSTSGAQPLIPADLGGAVPGNRGLPPIGLAPRRRMTHIAARVPTGT